jgi:hypothetical protein
VRGCPGVKDCSGHGDCNSAEQQCRCNPGEDSVEQFFFLFFFLKNCCWMGQITNPVIYSVL